VSPIMLPPKQCLILCADDDPDDQLHMMETIREIDPSIKLLSVSDGKEALYLLQTFKEANVLPDLIILDINMPRMDGKQALAKIKKDPILKQIPAVLFSTSGHNIDKMFGAKHSTQLVTKPVSLHEFKLAVQHMLGMMAAF